MAKYKNYNLKNNNTGEKISLILSENELLEYFEKNSNVSFYDETVLDDKKSDVIGAPRIAYNSSSGLRPDIDFNSRLKEIKKNHSSKYTPSTINTW